MREIVADRVARLALSCSVDCGDPAVCDLVQTSGAETAWARVREGAFGEPVARRAAAVEPLAVSRRAGEVGARFVIPGDEEWPDQLGDLQHCSPVNRRGGVPPGLWLRGPGHLAALAARSVAVVGSRASTSYGAGVAADLGADLAQQGVTVVSGGAFGIDAAAHRGALAVSGPTVCVLANGVDVPYPAGNTATWALECNRVLMAVPGPVHSAMSAAPHLMVRDGLATLVTNAGDVLELVSPAGEHLLPRTAGQVRPTDGFDPGRLAVYEAVPARRRASAGDIALAAGVTLPSCLADLAALELAGFVEAAAGGWRLAPIGSRP